MLDNREIWFLGLRSDKTVLAKGFDDEKGFYTLMSHDHIAFRFEILDLLGKGSFGQVVRAFDHKK